MIGYFAGTRLPFIRDIDQQTRPCQQDGQTFTTFLHAVTRAEDIAASLRARIMLVEDDLPALLADYRRQT